MKFIANDYKPNEILKFIRQNAGVTQAEFAKSLNKSKDWQQSNELGRTNYLFRDLLNIANVYNLEIVIQEKRKK